MVVMHTIHSQPKLHKLQIGIKERKTMAGTREDKIMDGVNKIKPVAMPLGETGLAHSSLRSSLHSRMIAGAIGVALQPRQHSLGRMQRRDVGKTIGRISRRLRTTMWRGGFPQELM